MQGRASVFGVAPVGAGVTVQGSGPAGLRVRGWWPALTVLPCALPQAGQTPLEAARCHNNPEVALLLTKAPQVGLTALSIVLTMWGYKVTGRL